MKLVKRSDLYKNPNSQFGLNQQIQRELCNGNAQFIIEMCRAMHIKMGYSVPCLAMHISNNFYNKKSYVNYDRFIMLAGSLLLASKLRDINCRIKDFCHAFYNVISKVSRTSQPYNQQKMTLIKDQIAVAQSELLRVLEYNCDYQLPLEFVNKLCERWIPEKDKREVQQRIFFTCRMLILDSYRTMACLIFHPVVIALSCFLIACRYENYTSYNCKEIQGKVKSDATEDQMYMKMLEIIGQEEKVDFKAEDVRDCLLMLNELICLYDGSHMMQIEPN